MGIDWEGIGQGVGSEPEELELDGVGMKGSRWKSLL